MRRHHVVLLGALVVLGVGLAAADDEVVPPAENLVVDGVPKVPASLAAAVASYTELRPTSFMAWHPTRREMLVSSTVDGVAQIHSLATPGGRLAQMTHAEKPTIYARYPRHRG